MTCGFRAVGFDQGCGYDPNGGGSSGAMARTISFTAAGGETDVTVPIGFSMPDDSYNIAWSLRAVTNTFIPTFPDALAGDRTTTTFRMLCDALTAGDTIEFTLTPR